jgi:YggT family protein
MLAAYLMLTLRVVVFAFFALATLVAATHWAVRNGHLTPFSPLPKLARRLGDPLTKPLERRMLRSGANPVNAPYVLFWVALLGGLALLAFVEWLIVTLWRLVTSAQTGPMGLLYFAVSSIFSILILAIFVRVIASWFGISPYSRPMRIVHGLTDWLIEPLRKVIPPLGMFDLSPLAALLLLYLLRGLVMGVLF